MFSDAEIRAFNMTISGGNIQVRVNDELTLDAGWWEEVRDDDGTVWRCVHPPATTMFEQVLDYLASSPQEPGYPGLRIGQEAIATTAVCLRWGSYLAVLLDQDKPLWTQAHQKELSRIADGEMARINIEASAALAQWIDIMRHDWRHYLALMWAARRLPMTRRSVQTDKSLPLLQLARPDATALVTPVMQSDEARAHPSRVLANALVNACWRNGPVEDIHAGSPSTYPLTQRRITPSEERTLTRTTAGHLAGAILAVFGLIHEQSERSWFERVLPFALAPRIAPTHWSPDERTRQVWLPGAEPHRAG